MRVTRLFTIVALAVSLLSTQFAPAVAFARADDARQGGFFAQALEPLKNLAAQPAVLTQTALRALFKAAAINQTFTASRRLSPDAFTSAIRAFSTSIADGVRAVSGATGELGYEVAQAINAQSAFGFGMSAFPGAISAIGASLANIPALTLPSFGGENAPAPQELLYDARADGANAVSAEPGFLDRLKHATGVWAIAAAEAADNKATPDIDDLVRMEEIKAFVSREMLANLRDRNADPALITGLTRQIAEDALVLRHKKKIRDCSFNGRAFLAEAKQLAQQSFIAPELLKKQQEMEDAHDRADAIAKFNQDALERADLLARAKKGEGEGRTVVERYNYLREQRIQQLIENARAYRRAVSYAGGEPDNRYYRAKAGRLRLSEIHTEFAFEEAFLYMLQDTVDEWAADCTKNLGDLFDQKVALARDLIRDQSLLARLFISRDALLEKLNAQPDLQKTREILRRVDAAFALLRDRAAPALAALHNDLGIIQRAKEKMQKSVDELKRSAVPRATDPLAMCGANNAIVIAIYRGMFDPNTTYGSAADGYHFGQVGSQACQTSGTAVKEVLSGYCVMPPYTLESGYVNFRAVQTGSIADGSFSITFPWTCVRPKGFVADPDVETCPFPPDFDSLCAGTYSAPPAPPSPPTPPSDIETKLKQFLPPLLEGFQECRSSASQTVQDLKSFAKASILAEIRKKLQAENIADAGIDTVFSAKSSAAAADAARRELALNAGIAAYNAARSSGKSIKEAIGFSLAKIANISIMLSFGRRVNTAWCGAGTSLLASFLDAKEQTRVELQHPNGPLAKAGSFIKAVGDLLTLEDLDNTINTEINASFAQKPSPGTEEDTLRRILAAAQQFFDDVNAHAPAAKSAITDARTQAQTIDGVVADIGRIVSDIAGIIGGTAMGGGGGGSGGGGGGGSGGGGSGQTLDDVLREIDRRTEELFRRGDWRGDIL